MGNQQTKKGEKESPFTGEELKILESSFKHAVENEMKITENKLVVKTTTIPIYCLCNMIPLKTSKWRSEKKTIKSYKGDLFCNDKEISVTRLWCGLCFCCDCFALLCNVPEFQRYPINLIDI